MHERMLDKLNTPTPAELAAWCGECETLYSDLLGFMTNQMGAEPEIRFPYGNSYGWCTTFRKKKKLICDIFPECGAVNVMLRLTDAAFAEAYPKLGAYMQSIIDNKYPCGSGGWIHAEIMDDERLEDIKLLLTIKSMTGSRGASWRKA